MPVINGEKFACSSCIKGHRVSGCTHTDRELHHINPKGRPVKQCEHCRGARKSKSHHAKCDCGDKKDKDKNKDKGDVKGEMIADIGVEEPSNRAVVDANSCCCHSGAKCICGMRKDSLDLKLDTGRQSLHDARAKPKLTSTHSESVLTVFANGHHKPCHRNNNTAHVSGAPYKIPRPHTLHGSTAFASYSQDNLLNPYGRSEAPAQRSMDTLSLSNTDFYAMFGSPPRSDGLSVTPLTSAGAQDSLFRSQGSNLFGQDGNSPPSEGLGDSTSTQKWPWANSVTLNGNFGLGSLSTSPSQDCLPNLQNDWSIPSAGLENPLWSAGDLPLDPNKLSDSITQPISHSGESNKQSIPPLTTASSAQSEIGEAVFGDLDFRNPQSAVSETLFWEDTPTFRLATSAAADTQPAPTSMPSATPGDRRSLDLDFLERMSKTSPFEPEINYSPNSMAFSDEAQPAKNVNGVPQNLTTTSPSDSAVFTTAEYTEPRAITIPNNIDDVVSNDPWLIDQNSTPFSGLAGGFDNNLTYTNWL